LFKFIKKWNEHICYYSRCKRLEQDYYFAQRIYGYEIQVTIEPITDEKKIASDLKKIFLEAKKIRISPKVNIDEICNKMNNDLL
jgi:hypothetical protein